jgi:hypothetical protein
MRTQRDSLGKNKRTFSGGSAQKIYKIKLREVVAKE